MVLKLAHTVAWILMLLNTQLFEGVLMKMHGEVDTVRDKLARFVVNTSPLKGWLGLLGLSIELYILWAY